MKMNNVENKGKGKNIAIIVLSIILIIVLGFICYDKLLKKEPIVNKEKNCPKCQECNNNKQEDMCLYDLKSLTHVEEENNLRHEKQLCFLTDNIFDIIANDKRIKKKIIMVIMLFQRRKKECGQMPALPYCDSYYYSSQTFPHVSKPSQTPPFDSASPGPYTPSPSLSSP